MLFNTRDERLAISAVANHETFEAVATPTSLAGDINQYTQFADKMPETGFIELMSVMAIDVLLYPEAISDRFWGN